MLNQLNIIIFNSINKFAGSNHILDIIAVATAKYLLFVFIIALLFFWFKNTEYKNIALYSGYSAILGLSLNFLITLFYFHPRPFMEHIGTLLINHVPETSFPSDHTTLMMSIAFMLLYYKKTRNIGIFLSLLSIIGGTARVFSGIHFPFDIIGSFFVAIIASYAVFLLKTKLQKLNKFILNLYFKILHQFGII